MEALYKVILEGKYPSISDKYSKEMRRLVKSLLQVQSQIRPNCDQILAMDSVQKRMAWYFPQFNEAAVNTSNILLKTI